MFDFYKTQKLLSVVCHPTRDVSAYFICLHISNTYRSRGRYLKGGGQCTFIGYAEEASFYTPGLSFARIFHSCTTDLRDADT